MSNNWELGLLALLYYSPCCLVGGSVSCLWTILDTMEVLFLGKTGSPVMEKSNDCGITAEIHN